MDHKLNKVVHDGRTGTVYVSLRPRTQRRPVATLEYPGRVILDLDEAGDIYGLRFMNVSPEEALRLTKLLKADDGRQSTVDS